VSRVNRATLAQSLSVSLPVGAYGLAFGAASVSAGFSVLQSCLISLLTFSGASQFALVGVIGSGGSALSATATASLLGTRNLLYGLRMAPVLQTRRLKKVIAAQLTIDESTGVAISLENGGSKAMRQGFWYTGIGVYFFWNLFTLLGALGAQAIGDPAAFGLDAAVPAAFLGLVWPRLIGNNERALAIASVAIALLLTPYVAAGLPIIITAFLAIAIGFRVRVWP
jgi:predicted branched-subunit amino acid permease